MPEDVVISKRKKGLVDTPRSGTSPTITDLISLKFPSAMVQPRVSPDGIRVAYAVRETNWNKNRYESSCWVHDLHRGESLRLTRSGDVKQIRWIDDSNLAVLREDPHDEKAKPQVWIFEGLVGEGLRLTDHETGVQAFEPFGGGILFLADDPGRSKREDRTDEFGSFTHFEQEESASALYYTDIEKMRDYFEEVRRSTEDEAKELVKPVVDLSRLMEYPLKIDGMVISPRGDAVYLNCRSKDYLVYSEETSVYQLKLDPEEALRGHLEHVRSKKDEAESGSEEKDHPYPGELTRVSLPEGSSVAAVSPDGSRLMVRRKERDNKFYTQSDLWILDLSVVGESLDEPGLENHLLKITGNLDRETSNVEWVASGIFTRYVDGTRTRIVGLSELGDVKPLDLAGISPVATFHVSKSGLVAFVGTDGESFWELYASDMPLSSNGWSPKRLTDFGVQVEGWDLGTVETIRWRSRDGTEIEGVLRKPRGFDPGRRYPLVFVVHGGPRSYNGEFLLEWMEISNYPAVQFVNKGILVLKPNYRGSVGRGQEFTELNVDNLGVGDLWDLESAIDYLDSKGIVDTSRVGCMGWSQGGYISAFAGLRSDRFRAVSVGAGVSDWYTYHITNDIPQFTTHYLSASPFDDRDPYVKTAPISGLKEAKTPTLIQHGGKDQRVPLANAKELYRGLKQMGVSVELFVYPEMAHPVKRPRENRAVMHQNLTWFSHHLLGEELDFQLHKPSNKK
jgi:dipeptidyl aminopeptidase/acylaminoacyl peptidase